MVLVYFILSLGRSYGILYFFASSWRFLHDVELFYFNSFTDYWCGDTYNLFFNLLVEVDVDASILSSHRSKSHEYYGQ